jgi:hypothetical protein
MSRAALVNDGVPAFLAMLVLALVLTVIAVIRLPRWTDTHTDEDEQPEPGQPVSAWPAAGWAVPDPAAADRPAPGRAGTAPAASGRTRPAHARHGHGRTGPAGVRPAGQQVLATSALSLAGSPSSQSGEEDFTSRSTGGPVPWRGTVRAPKVSGSPPWEPAPRPPG